MFQHLQERYNAKLWLKKEAMQEKDKEEEKNALLYLREKEKLASIQKQNYT